MVIKVQVRHQKHIENYYFCSITANNSNQGKSLDVDQGTCHVSKKILSIIVFYLITANNCKQGKSSVPATLDNDEGMYVRICHMSEKTLRIIIFCFITANNSKQGMSLDVDLGTCHMSKRH